MDVLTAATILNQQTMQIQDFVQQLTTMTSAALYLANESNSVAAINPQIKAYVASMNVVFPSITAQTTLTQAALDELAQLVK